MQLTRLFNALRATHLRPPAWVMITVASIIILGPPTVRLLGGGVLQANDLNVPPTNWNDAIGLLVSAWNFQGFGFPAHPSDFLVLQAMVGAALQSAAGAQALLYTLPLCLAPVAAYLYFKSLGLRSLRLILAGIVYLTSPWLAFNYISGEPVFLWMFALLPLSLFGYLKLEHNPNRFEGYAILVVVFAVGGAFTLQTVIVFAFLGIPAILSALDSRNRRSLIGILFGLCMAASVAVLSSLVAVGGYATAVNTEAGLTAAQYFGGFNGSETSEIRLAGLCYAIVLALGILLIVSDKRRPAGEKAYALGFGLLGASFGLLLASVPSPGAYWIFLHAPVLSPFLDPDKFLLIAWLSAAITVALLIKSGRRVMTVRSNPETDMDGKDSGLLAPITSRLCRRAVSYGQRYPGSSILTGTAFVLVAATLLISVLLPLGGEAPINLWTGNNGLETHHVPEGYFSVESFLLSKGINFGFGARTLVMPTNPGTLIPFYIAQTVIPGYVPPSGIMQNVTQGVSSNDSQSAKSWALMGVEYIVVPPTPKDPWWPLAAQGQPTSAGIAPGEFIAQGNPLDYDQILGSWSGLVKVYNASGFTVFEDSYFVGPIYSYSNFTAVTSIAEQPGFSTLAYTPTGPNVISNSNLTTGSRTGIGILTGTEAGEMQGLGPDLVSYSNLTPPSPWVVTARGNATLLPNGTLEVGGGSQGVTATLSLGTIPAPACYLLSFAVTTNPGYLGPPPGTVDQTLTGLLWPSGGLYTLPIQGPVSGTQYYGLNLSSSTSPVNGTVLVQSEPPATSSPVYTTFTNITLRQAPCAAIPFPINPTQWQLAGGIGQVLPNGSLEVPDGSLGFALSQQLTLRTNETYLLSFGLYSDPTYVGYPPGTDQRTDAAVYWSGGAAVFDTFTTAVNGSFRFAFVVPSMPVSNLTATLVLGSEPPLSPGPLVTRFSSVSLQPAVSHDTFPLLLSHVGWQATDPTSFSVAILNRSASFLSICTSFDRNWIATSASGTRLAVIDGPDGFLTVLLPPGTPTVLISYSQQQLFGFSVAGGLAALTSSIAAAIWAGVSLSRRRS